MERDLRAETNLSLLYAVFGHSFVSAIVKETKILPFLPLPFHAPPFLFLGQGGVLVDKPQLSYSVLSRLFLSYTGKTKPRIHRARISGMVHIKGEGYPGSATP